MFPAEALACGRGKGEALQQYSISPYLAQGLLVCGWCHEWPPGSSQWHCSSPPQAALPPPSPNHFSPSWALGLSRSGPLVVLRAEAAGVLLSPAFVSVPGLPGEVDQRPRTSSVASSIPQLSLSIQVEREEH